ncbi:MBL fold metallo-hydrolase [Pararhodobacter oceanensis]|uniref:MBL fold metallo-hydrolase n=1 Tax=Pararhodobacter oceanensis TaxID=2172121 RepID=UPI003A9246D0
MAEISPISQAAATSGFAPLPGQPLTLEPGLRLLLAPNPSPMTERGTNTYILGDTELMVIDPGPASEPHLAAILAAVLPGQQIAKIIVTHSHLDHSPAARPLSQATGAPVYAFGDSLAGRSPRMQALAAADIGGGEGVDMAFQPDICLPDGCEVEAGGHLLTALHTPGHLGNHLCFQWRDALFTGDHIMEWAPSLVSPPDGDLTDFMASLTLIEALGPLRYYSGHGAPIPDGLARTRALRAHRLSRESSIVSAVNNGARNIEEITAAVYSDIPPALLPAAARNVLAHLIDLDTRHALRFTGAIGLHAQVAPI